MDAMFLTRGMVVISFHRSAKCLFLGRGMKCDFGKISELL